MDATSNRTDMTPKPMRKAQDVINQIPSNWRDAEICIVDNIGRPFAIRRIALEKNTSGRRVILLHSEETGPAK